MNNFLKTVSVIDTETTNINPQDAEIVEVAEVHWNGDAWITSGMLLGAEHGIPPAASAKNNISNRMIAGKPLFRDSLPQIKDLLHWTNRKFWVAHNANYDQQVLNAAFSKCGIEEDINICNDRTRWLCTWRLSRHIIPPAADEAGYSLNYLRYRLDLPVPDNMRVHRAVDDAYLCAILFEYLVKLAIDNGFVDNDYDLGTQLNELCWSPIIQPTWPYGKYKGWNLSDISNDYYLWALKNMNGLNESDPAYDYDLAESVRLELERRIDT